MFKSKEIMKNFCEECRKTISNKHKGSKTGTFMLDWSREGTWPTPVCVNDIGRLWSFGK